MSQLKYLQLCRSPRQSILVDIKQVDCYVVPSRENHWIERGMRYSYKYREQQRLVPFQDCIDSWGVAKPYFGHCANCCCDAPWWFLIVCVVIWFEDSWSLEENEPNHDFDLVSKEHVPWCGETSLLWWWRQRWSLTRIACWRCSVVRPRLFLTGQFHNRRCAFPTTTVSCAMMWIA